MDQPVNRHYQVPYLAGYSEDAKTIYIDRRLPRYIRLRSGRTISPDRYLRLHESTEKHLMDTRGYKYQYAHEMATAAERRAVERDGVDWNEYSNALRKYITEDEKCTGPIPPDIDLKPEHDYRDYPLLHRLEKKRKHTLEQLRTANPHGLPVR